MKTASRLIFAAALVGVAASPSLSDSKKIDGAVHVGHTGDVRALLHAGGSLWIGTSGGLFRYDLGSDEFVDHWEVGERLPSNSVRALCAKGDSVLVGTDAGLSVYDGTAVSVYTNKSRGVYGALSFDLIRSIDVGRTGDIFIGTFGSGVGVMQARQGTAITREDSLLDNKVYGVVEKTWGARYFATSMGLCAYRDSAWVGFQAGAGIPRGEVRAIIDADGDRMVLLAGVGGVYRFDGKRATRLSPEGVFDGDDIAALTMDVRGNLWAAGRFGGIAVYQDGRWTRISEGDAVVNSSAWRSAYADADGGVFFGSADGLVAMVRDNIVRKIRLPDGLPSGSVRSITVAGTDVFFLSGRWVVRASGALTGLTVDDAPDGLVSLATGANDALWGAGRWGVFKRGADGYAEFRDVTGTVDPAFTALCVDSRGWVWTALRSGAVYRYDDELWVPIADPDELFGGPVDGLVAGERGLWSYADDGGVALFDRVKWTVYSLESFGGETMRDVAVSYQGAVVAATSTRLWLYRDDTKDWQPVEVAGGTGVKALRVFVTPPSHEINSVSFDSRGNMYLASEGGLGVVGPEGVRWLGAMDGLGGTAVLDVTVEGEDAVWLGFRSDGLTRIPIKSLW